MSRASSTPSPVGTNKYSVLPPVQTSESDKVFMRQLQDYIEDELQDIRPSQKKQRFMVFSTAFSKLIEYVQGYKPLMTRIKKEYEDVINTIERGKEEASYLGGKLQAMAQEPTTLRNYRRRSDELSKRIAVIRTDNDRLKQELLELKKMQKNAENEARQASQAVRKQAKKDSRTIPAKKKKHPSKFVPGLTLEESTNVDSLQRELNKVENHIKELSMNKKAKYSDRQHKEDLKDKLAKKVAERDILQQRNNWLIAKQRRLKIAHDSALAYMNSTEPQYRTIADVIIMALAKSKSSHGDEQRSFLLQDVSSAHIEDDDPTKEKEAEMILEYIEKFNELFEDGRYEEAAIHAANSPKGILRTMETMSRFKSVSAKHDGRSPWLAFCDAVMSSVLALGVKPSDTISIECVSCALKENRLDLLSHWIAQDRLTVTETLGDMISSHCKGKNRTYLDMAEKIYRSCYAHAKVVDVIVRQGLYKRAMEYARERDFIINDYLKLLTKYPSYQLGYAMAEQKEKDRDKFLIPIGTICRSLFDTDSHEVAFQILQKLLLRGPEETGTENNGLRLAVYGDDTTSTNQWQTVVKAAQEYGYEEVSVELLAAVTVHKAMKLTRDASDLSDDQFKSELNFSSPGSSHFYQPDTSAEQS